MDQNFSQTTKYCGLLQLWMQMDAHAKAFDLFLTADTTYFLLDKRAIIIRTVILFQMNQNGKNMELVNYNS